MSVVRDTPAWLRTVLVVLAICLALYGFTQILAGLTPFLAAFAIAYLLNPSLNAFEVRVRGLFARMPGIGKKLDARAVAVLLTLASAAAIVIVILAFLVPALFEQANEAAASLPTMIDNVRTRIEPMLQRFNVKYPDESSQIRDLLGEKIKEKLPDLLAPVTHFLRYTLESTFGFVALFIHLFVVPVFAAYLLYDMNHIRAGVVTFIPPARRPWLLDRLRKVEALLTAFVRGQVTVCFILAVFYGTSLSFLGVPLGLIVGFCIGFFNLVPFMAFIAGLPLALVIAWGGDCSSGTLAAIVVVFLIGKFSDIYVLSPRIVGESLGLHAIVIILALLLGGEYFGFAGLLLAVPITAAASVFWPDLVAAYKASRFYNSDDTPVSSGGTLHAE